jgi:hypothetical protein
MKKSIQDFITLFEQHKEQFQDAVLSSPQSENSQFKKVHIRPVLLKNKKSLQVNSFTKTQCFTKNHPYTELAALFSSLFANYKQGVVRTENETFYVHRDQEGTLSWKQKKLRNTPPLHLEHNRKKHYLIPEGTPVDFLVALDIMDAKGNVLREKFDKFKQVNQFLQHVFEFVDFEKTKEYTIVDFGCGKAILTFALAHLLRDHKVRLIGIDLKQELLEKCKALSARLGFTNLLFCSTSIEAWTLPRISHKISREVGQDVAIDCAREPREHYQVDKARGSADKDMVTDCSNSPKDCEKCGSNSPVDLVIALHACNTASDDAIMKACALDAKALLIAPCCHSEVQRHIQKKALPLILKHPLLKERFSSLLTDALRLEFLSQKGYKVDVVEFVDPEHTPKNILIRARKLPYFAAPDLTEYTACLQEFGLTNI